MQRAEERHYQYQYTNGMNNILADETDEPFMKAYLNDFPNFEHDPSIQEFKWASAHGHLNVREFLNSLEITKNISDTKNVPNAKNISDIKN